MGSRSMRLIVTGGLMLTMFVLLAGPAAAHEEREVGGLRHWSWASARNPPTPASRTAWSCSCPKAATPSPISATRSPCRSASGTRSKDLSVEPFFEVGEFGTPGDYRAWFIPTRAGQYSFHFTGTIRGTKIDETFTSGPKTFGDVENPTDAEFPVQDPTNGELSERIDREIPRLEASITDVKTSIDRSVESAVDDVSSARTLALVGVALGALGLIAAIAAIAMTRRSSP